MASRHNAPAVLHDGTCPSNGCGEPFALSNHVVREGRVPNPVLFYWSLFFVRDGEGVLQIWKRCPRRHESPITAGLNP